MPLFLCALSSNLIFNVSSNRAVRNGPGPSMLLLCNRGTCVCVFVSVCYLTQCAACGSSQQRAAAETKSMVDRRARARTR